jgi:hypothetical protein
MDARTNAGRLPPQNDRRRSLAAAKPATFKAMLLSVRNYIRREGLEPEVLRIAGEESRANGTDKLTSRQIDQEIKTARRKKPKRG